MIPYSQLPDSKYYHTPSNMQTIHMTNALCIFIMRSLSKFKQPISKYAFNKTIHIRHSKK